MLRRSVRVCAVMGCLAVSMPCAASAQEDPCPQFGAQGHLPALVAPGLLPRTTLLCNADYAVLNSGLVHEPLWSAEYLTRREIMRASQLGRVTDRPHADPRLPPGDGADPADYRRSGYARGRMTPASEAPDMAGRDQAFSLANVVPQTPELNKGIWSDVERAVRKLALQEGALYVVTGPAFYGSTQGIGHHVVVPSSTWKAVYDPMVNAAGVYVCKNTENPTCTVVNVATLIRAVGVDPFPALPDTLKETLLALPDPEDSSRQP